MAKSKTQYATLGYITSIGRYRELQPSLFNDFLALRKRVFVDEMGWKSMSEANGAELDEYDNAETVYIICHTENGEVVGGARLLPTDQEHHISPMGIEPVSYMIRDASLGRLDELPQELCSDAVPQDPKIIELTRLVAEHPGTAAKILNALNQYMQENDLRTCLFLGRPAFMRMAKMMGFSPVPLGPVLGNDSGRFLAFSCNVISLNNEEH